MKTTEDLLYLVSCAVNEKQPDAARCAAMDLPAVFELAHNQMLACTAAFALKRVMPLDAAWEAEQGNVMRRQILYRAEKNRVLQTLEDNGVWYMPLKGIVIRECYPNETMREMVDQDILFDAGKADLVRSLMESIGYTCEEFDVEAHAHDVYHKPPVYCFEMHRTLMNHYADYALFDYYRKKENLLKKDSGNRFGYHMSNEDFYIYLICHMFKHYAGAGIGLRALVDIRVYLRRYGDELDRAYLAEELAKLKLVGFESKMRGLACKIFSGQPLSEEEERELYGMAESDSHGSARHQMANRLGNRDSAGAKFRYVLNRVFPPPDSLRVLHPVVYRYKVLYPFFVIGRPVAGLVKHPKRLLREFGSLVRYKSDTD